MMIFKISDIHRKIRLRFRKHNSIKTYLRLKISHFNTHDTNWFHRTKSEYKIYILILNYNIGIIIDFINNIFYLSTYYYRYIISYLNLLDQNQYLFKNYSIFSISKYT